MQSTTRRKAILERFGTVTSDCPAAYLSTPRFRIRSA